MTRFISPLHSINFVDANFLDKIADGESNAVNEILSLVETNEINLLLPYSVQNELNNPNTPAHVKKAATLFLFSIPVQLTEEELHGYRDFVVAVQGEAKDKNIAPDLFHVYEADKYGGCYFITHDKRLLTRSNAIASILQINVVTPTEFLKRLAPAKT